jgi:hypothetical protein
MSGQFPYRRRDFAAALATTFLAYLGLRRRRPECRIWSFSGSGRRGAAGTLKGFQTGLHEFGYEEGRGPIVGSGCANGSDARLAELAAAAVATRPDLISAFGGVVIGASRS